MALEPTRRHLNGLGKEWANNIPTTKFLWTIDFQGRSGAPISKGLASSVKQVLQDYEGNRWSFLDGLFDERSDAELGFLYAQAVSLPQEQMTVGTLPVGRSGGIVAGYYGDRRTDYGSENKLDVTFLEQNKDVVDLFIRPWLVAVSYHGLIEDDETDLKCNIVVNLHSKNPDGKGFKDVPFGDMVNKRKTYLFEDCVPITVEADQLSMNGDTSQSDITRTCSFAFSKYSTYDVDTAAGGRQSRELIGDFNTDIFRPIA